MPKFGLIAVDRETQKGTVKSSSVMLGKDCQEQLAMNAVETVHGNGNEMKSRN